MPTILIDFLTRRGLAAAAPLIAGCLLLAGCGGSGNSSGNSSSPSTGSALAASLVKAMATNQPQLKDVKVHCPAGSITKYPVKCSFTGSTHLAVKGKHLKLPSAGTVRVNGARAGQLKYIVVFGSAH